MDPEIEKCLKEGDVEGVGRLFDAKMEAASDDDAKDVLLVGKGHTMYQLGRKEEALECMKKARESAKSDSQKSFLDNFVAMIEGERKASVDQVMAAAGVHHKVNGGVLADGTILHEGVIVEPACKEEVQCATNGLSGFTDKQQAIIKHVSLHGTTNEAWATLSTELNTPVHELTATWYDISPSLKGIIEKDPEMPCGHTCGTCPTKTSCMLHDELVDLEDL